MITRYKDLEGFSHSIITVQRAIGLFVILDNNKEDQEQIVVNEVEYHKMLEKLILEEGGILI